ncbi:DUF2231 domain-containing protein [Yinghuangia aomiensis]
MFDTVFGLPVHVLVLHFAVVLVPLAALATIAVAVRPAWLPRFGVWVAALDAVMVVLVWATKESGEKLLKRIYLGSVRPPGGDAHAHRARRRPALVRGRLVRRRGRTGGGGPAAGARAGGHTGHRSGVRGPGGGGARRRRGSAGHRAGRPYRACGVAGGVEADRAVHQRVMPG